MAYPRTLTLLALLTLPACGPGDDSTTGTSTTASSSTEPTTEPTTATTGSSSTEPTTNPTTDPTSTTGTTTDTTTDLTGSTTAHATTGGAVCPEPLPMPGSPCDSEGLFCSSGCEDPCQFCNVVHCEGGTWKGQEVFPVDCLDCDPLCDFVVAAACAGGPPDKDICVAGCMDNQTGACKTEFNQVRACAGGQPTFTCDAMTRPTVAGCEASFEALYMCMR